MHWPMLVALVFLVHATAARHHHHHHELDAPKVSAPEKIIVVDAVTGITYNPYSKQHPGRHVCTNQKDVVMPVKTKQTFCKPTYKKYQQRCNDNQLCSGVRVVYETAYRDIVTSKQNKQLTYVCCPGWKQATNRSYGCNKPICVNECQNGGTCSKPDTCNCAEGYQGRSCEFDIDECKEKPCDQICLNTPGSYKCECRENFTLKEDGQTCTKEDDEPGYEAKELQFESIDERLHTLEVIINENKNNEMTQEIKELKSDIQFINKDISTLQSQLQDVETYKKNINQFQMKLHQIEKKSIKIDELSAKYDKLKKCAFYNKICI